MLPRGSVLHCTCVDSRLTLTCCTRGASSISIFIYKNDQSPAPFSILDCHSSNPACQLSAGVPLLIQFQFQLEVPLRIRNTATLALAKPESTVRNTRSVATPTAQVRRARLMPVALFPSHWQQSTPKPCDPTFCLIDKFTCVSVTCGVSVSAVASLY